MKVVGFSTCNMNLKLRRPCGYSCSGCCTSWWQADSKTARAAFPYTHPGSYRG